MCSVCHDRHWQNCCQKGVLFYRAANETVETFGLAKAQKQNWFEPDWCNVASELGIKEKQVCYRAFDPYSLSQRIVHKALEFPVDQISTQYLQPSTIDTRKIISVLLFI
jgi:hypothetical protein